MSREDNFFLLLSAIGLALGIGAAFCPNRPDVEGVLLGGFFLCVVTTTAMGMKYR